MRGFWQASACSFRITCGDTIYRMYLSPHKGARKLSRDQFEGIEGALNASSAAGMLVGGSIAGFSGVLDLAGNAVGTYSAMRSLTMARRNYKLLQERVSGYGEKQVT